MSVVADRLARADVAAWPVIDRWAVRLVPVPVAVWLLTSTFHVTATGLDVFHGGELLAATRRITGGELPWREVIFVHGVTDDVLPGLVAPWPLRGKVECLPGRWTDTAPSGHCPTAPTGRSR